MSAEKPILYVEGANDCFSIINLMMADGISWVKGSEPVQIESKNSVSALLEAMSVAVKTALKNRQTIGFVLDIDDNVEGRWASVMSRLENGGMVTSGVTPDRDGLILTSGDVRIGVWLMPDNVSPKGRLEDFLATLIPHDDKHYDLSKKYVSEAGRLSAPKTFRSIDADKAELSAYLAVKDPPGITYGNAIKAQIFKAPSDAARRFVAWFRKLYGLTEKSGSTPPTSTSASCE